MTYIGRQLLASGKRWSTMRSCTFCGRRPCEILAVNSSSLFLSVWSLNKHREEVSTQLAQGPRAWCPSLRPVDCRALLRPQHLQTLVARWYLPAASRQRVYNSEFWSIYRGCGWGFERGGSKSSYILVLSQAARGHTTRARHKFLSRAWLACNFVLCSSTSFLNPHVLGIVSSPCENAGFHCECGSSGETPYVQFGLQLMVKMIEVRKLYG
jgi:hypothetical protein